MAGVHLNSRRKLRWQAYIEMPGANRRTPKCQAERRKPRW
jgi:hypothetical protein